MSDSKNKKAEGVSPATALNDSDSEELFELKSAASAQATADKLEAKYADRGLKFTSVFAGACPVQAYGHLDGLRFYFRFRGNTGRLNLGPYDQTIEELIALRHNEQSNINLEVADSKLKAGLISEDEHRWKTLVNAPSKIVLESDTQFYPTAIFKEAISEGSDAEDHLKGYLSELETFEMFSQLADTLTVRLERERINEGTRIYLFEGQEAAQAYRAR